MTPIENAYSDRQKELLELMDYKWEVLLGEILANDFYESDEEAEKVYQIYLAMVSELIGNEILSWEE